MPILFLQPFPRGLARITALWSAYIAAEERVIDRARSLYLFRWWTQVPIHGDRLRIWVTNLAPLRERLAQRRDTAPSLVEPVLGIAGSITGALFSPTGVFAAVLLGAQSRTWLVHSLNVLVNGLWIGAVAAGLLAPVGVAVVLPGQIANLESLGRLAAAIDRSHAPPEALHLADRFAAFVAMLAGTFAVAIVTFGPVVWRAAHQLAFLAPLARTSAELVTVIILFTAEYLATALPQHYAGLTQIFRVLGGAFRMAGERMAAVWGKVAGDFSQHVRAAGDGMGAWWRQIEDGLKTDLPVVGVWPQLVERLRIVKEAWEHATDKGPAEGYWQGTLTNGKFRGGLKDDVDYAVAPVFEDEVPMGPVAFHAPRVPALRLPPVPAPPPFASEYRGARFYAGQMDVLLATPAARIAPAAWGVLNAVAERVLEPALDGYLPQLDDVFATLQERPAPLPVKDLPQTRVLRPQVGRLRVRTTRAGQAHAKAWGEALREALRREHYLVPEGV